MSAASPTNDKNRKQLRTAVRFAVVLLILAPPLWISNYCYRRARLFGEASEAPLEPPDSPLLSTVFGSSTSEFFGEPVRLSFPQDVRLSASQTRLIGGYERLKSLSASGLDDDDVRRLRNLSNLDYLTLDDSHLSDEGLRIVAGFTKLRSLVIIAAPDSLDGQITTDGVRQLTKLKSLQELTLVSPDLDDACLEPLGQMTGLTRLRITSPNVHGDGLHHLGRMTSLFSLDLSNCPLDRPGCLNDLSSNTGVRVLWLRGASVTDRRLNELVPLAGLIDLRVERTTVSDGGARQLQPG